MRILTSILLITVGFVCGAKEITIIPQYSVGDTLRYRTTAIVKMYHEQDSMYTKAVMTPEMVIEDKNEEGYVVGTSNKLDAFEFECSTPEAEAALPVKREQLQDFVATIRLKLKLDSYGRPDSVLNIAEVRDSLLGAYEKMFIKNFGVGAENKAEWEADTKPLLQAAVLMTCNTKHLSDEQFGNTAYFSFVGVPLKPGKIPTSMVLTDDMQRMVHGLETLKMDISDSTGQGLELNGCGYQVTVTGKKGKSSVEGEWLFIDGILQFGYIVVKGYSDKEKCLTYLSIEGY